MAKILRCKLDGRQSVTFPVNLKRNGRFLTEPVSVVVRGFVKFEDEPVANVEQYESNAYQRDSANQLKNKSIVYPVLFTSDAITINNGRGTVTLLPRSEDILSDFNTISGRSEGSSSADATEVLEKKDSNIVIEVGVERLPYQISIEVTIVDDSGQIFGQTVDRGSEDTEDADDGLFKQEKQQQTSNLIIETYSDIEWIPSVESMLDDNAGTSEEALDALNNLSNEIPFGSSAMYDAIVASAKTLSTSDPAINPLRKVIYLLTDNDSNMSISTSDEAIDEVNAIDGFKRVPIISGNLQVIDSDITQTFLSAKANKTDTVNLNKLGFLTGGQSVTVLSEEFIDEIVDVFYGEAVGALGYGYYEFIVDLQKVVALESILGDFSITDVRSSASWKIELSNDGYTFIPVDDEFATTTTYQPEDMSARFIKFKVTLLTGFSSDEYLGEPESPSLNNFKIIYNESKVVFLFLNSQDDGLPPYQMVIGVDGNPITPEQVEVGLSKSDSSNWEDFSNGSQPTVDQNGKIIVPLRFSQDTEEFPQEPLIKIDDFTLKTSYSSWDPYSTTTIYDKENKTVSSSEYKLYPREGLIVFNTILPYDYVEGDFSIGILNGNDYKLGLKLTNISNEQPLELYGIGKMYTTGKDLLPPVDKIAPEVQEVTIEPQAPNVYSPISLSYVYFDSNFETEDVSQREIRWYINGVRVSYLDGLTSWNDLSNTSDPIYQNALSFTTSDLTPGQTVEQKARSLGESILKVGDTIYSTIKVSDGELFSNTEKSDTILVVEAAPTVSDLRIQAFDNNGAIIDRITSNNTAFVTFTLNGDVTGNQSEIIWYVDTFEFKRGIYGEEVSPDQSPHDQILPGEVSINTLDWALKLGNEIYVQIIPNTGSSVGSAVSSEPVIVDNAFPEATNAIVKPVVATQFAPLTLTWDFTDFDIDVLKDGTQTEETVIEWYRKIPPVDASQSTIFRKVVDEDTLDFITTDIVNHTSIVDSAILNVDEQWYAKVTPNDSLDDGEEVITNIKIITSG